MFQYVKYSLECPSCGIPFTVHVKVIDDQPPQVCTFCGSHLLNEDEEEDDQ